MPTLGVVVLSLGRTKHLAECLRSVAWADKVLLVHAGGAEPEIGAGDWPSLGIRQVASLAAAEKLLVDVGTDWVLQLWAEERLEPELAENLKALCRAAPRNGSGLYRIAVRSRILGAWVEGGVAGPSPAVRLSHHRDAMPPGWWSETRSSGTLERGCIRDYGCAELARAVERVQELSDFWAASLRGAAAPPGGLESALVSLKVFFKILLQNRVFSRGIAGVALSALASYAVLLSGAKVWEAKHAGAKRNERGDVMAGGRIWGDLPEGFIKWGGREHSVAVRADAAAELKNLLNGRSGGGEESRFHGRAKLSVLRMENGAGALVRRYCHGGALRYLTGDIFVTWPPRPFKELAVTEEARRRGVPTVEILAAGIDRIWGPLYRGWLVTRELEGARDLWAVLQERSFPTTALLRAVAQALERMHRLGIYHGDLNLRNILIRREGDALKAYVIDFDKAVFSPGGVPAAKVRRNLARLRRSIAKLDPGARYLSPGDWEELLALYREAAAP